MAKETIDPIQKRKLDLLKLIDSTNSGNKKGESVVGLGDLHTHVPKWSTGIEDLDKILGGGIPYGRIVEIFGAESSGKTTLLYHLLSLHNIALDIPIEGTFDRERCELFGNHEGQLFVSQARYGEDALNICGKFAMAGMPIIGIDSVPSLVPKADFEKIEKAINKDTIEVQRVGGIATLLNSYLPVIEDSCELTGSTVIFINQLRDTIGALPFAEQTHTAGGRKLKHACSLRLQVARREWIKIPNKNPFNSATNETIGIIMKVKVVKSKVCCPLGECELVLMFDRGFIPFDDLDKVRAEIMKARKEEFSGKTVVTLDSTQQVNNEQVNAHLEVW